MPSFDSHLSAFEQSKDIGLLIQERVFDSPPTVEQIIKLIGILNEAEIVNAGVLGYLGDCAPKEMTFEHLQAICTQLPTSHAAPFLDRYIEVNPSYKANIYTAVLNDDRVWNNAITAQSPMFDAAFKAGYFTRHPTRAYLLDDLGLTQQLPPISNDELPKLLRRVAHDKKADVFIKIVGHTPALLRQDENFLSVLNAMSVEQKKNFLDKVITQSPLVKAAIENNFDLQIQLLDLLPTDKLDFHLIKGRYDALRSTSPHERDVNLFYQLRLQSEIARKIPNEGFSRDFLVDLVPKKRFTTQEYAESFADPSRFFDAHNTTVLDSMIEHAKEQDSSLDLQVVRVRNLEKLINEHPQKRFQVIVNDETHYAAIDVIKNAQPPHSVVIMDSSYPHYASLVAKIESIFSGKLHTHPLDMVTIQAIDGKTSTQSDLKSCLLFSFDCCMQLHNEPSDFHERLKQEQRKQYSMGLLAQISEHEPLEKNKIYTQKLGDSIHYKILVEHNGDTQIINGVINKDDLPPAEHEKFDALDNNDLASFLPLESMIKQILVQRKQITVEGSVQWHQLAPNYWWNMQSLKAMKTCEEYAMSFNPASLTRPLYQGMSFQDYKVRGVVTEALPSNPNTKVERNKSIVINVLERVAAPLRDKYHAALVEERARDILDRAREALAEGRATEQLRRSPPAELEVESDRTLGME